MSCSDEGRNKPLVELVHSFQVHIVGQPHVFIHQIEGCMCNELVQVTMIILWSRNKIVSNKMIHKHTLFILLRSLTVKTIGDYMSPIMSKSVVSLINNHYRSRRKYTMT